MASCVILLATASHAEDDTQRLIMRLGANRPVSQRIAAAQSLGDSTDESALQAVNALAEACTDQDPQMRKLPSSHSACCCTAISGPVTWRW
jgi:hypothetical protein